MNSRHLRTVKTIYAMPTTAALEWSRIESLLTALGCQLIEGRGSRVRFQYQGRIAAFHRPHPQKEAKPYQVEQARAFLESIGVQP